MSPTVSRSLSEKLQHRQELQLKTLEHDREAHRERADAADERTRAALQHISEVQIERGKIHEALVAAKSEKRALEDAMHRLEQDLTKAIDGQRILQGRIEMGEARLAESQSERDALRELKVEAERNLAVMQAHKSGVEDLAKRAMAQLRLAQDDKKALQARLDATEARLVQASQQQQVIQQGQGKAQEERAVMQAELRALEEKLRRSEQQLTDERSKFEARISAAEGETKHLLADKDRAHEERRLTVEQLAVLQTEKLTLEQLLQRCEQQLQDERSAWHTRELAYEAQMKDAVAKQDSVRKELTRAQEATALAEGEKRGMGQMLKQMEQQMATLRDDYDKQVTTAASATERYEVALQTNEVLRKELSSEQQRLVSVQAEQTQGSSTLHLLEQQLAVASEARATAEQRLKTADERCDALGAECEVIREQLRSTSELLNSAELERVRSGEQLNSLRSEKIALEELTLHVHEVTRTMSAMHTGPAAPD